MNPYETLLHFTHAQQARDTACSTMAHYKSLLVLCWGVYKWVQAIMMYYKLHPSASSLISSEDPEGHRAYSSYIHLYIASECIVSVFQCIHEEV